MEKESYTVPRRYAADLLNVSLRTLDRYAKKGTISSFRHGRELAFSEQEILDFKAKLLAQEEGERLKFQKFMERGQQPQQRRANDFANVEAAQVLEQGSDPSEYDTLDEGFAKIRDNLLRRSPEENIYKALYEKNDEELKTVRQKLEVANYQLGKLETQIKTMVPMLEFKKQHQELLLLTSHYREKEQGIVELQRQVQIEQFAKKVYAVFLFFMMALMPLLVILKLLS